ncbi:MAG: DUF2309 domain-containing protein, partial [Myxococcota bacterium]
EACARIAPTWPLDRFIAVNPFWNLIERPLPEVEGQLGALSGTRLTMDRAFYAHALERGLIGEDDLQAAIDEDGANVSVDELRALVAQEATPRPLRGSAADVADGARDLVHEMAWRQYVPHRVSQFCAAYFDERGQALLGPDRSAGLFTSWLAQASLDRSPGLQMGLGRFGEFVATLPRKAVATIAQGLDALGVAEDERSRYLLGLLLDQNGWASWCAYQRWEARLSDGDDETIVDLLAIRVAWEWVLFQSFDAAQERRWQQTMRRWAVIDASHAANRPEWLLQRAMERAYQRQLCTQLPAGFSAKREASRPDAQAIFCIDVRSEVLRRALERGEGTIHTLGFAGFFGIPLEYRPSGTSDRRPQLPGLLSPRFVATDGIEPKERQARLEAAHGMKGLKGGAVSAFPFVEAFGLGYAGALLKRGFQRDTPTNTASAKLTAAEQAARKPQLTAHTCGAPIQLSERAEIAASMLRSMSLTQGLARLVLLAGHGSHTTNNPHAAGLDCGACCGQSGEVNARAAVAVLNDPDVQRELATQGIAVPEDTYFIAGLHDTTTEEVTLFGLCGLPESHRAEASALKARLAAAAAVARAERAPKTGVQGPQKPSRLRKIFQKRTRDWSETRPEWGLAGNAAFIVAPRERSAHMNLQGRSFLHEYRFEDDAEFKTLELIMTAPMVVAHWINLQYYASTVDNLRYGSGNKVLHNVVGGRIGVFEGNGGDLRIGLSMQSLHDGKDWAYEPLRLSVFIEAPCAPMDAILGRHAHVRQLVEGGWLDLFQLDRESASVRRYRQGDWLPVQ